MKMRILFLILILTTTVKANAQQANIVEALNLLNEIRAKPGNFNREVGVLLNDIVPRPALKWNQILANVAQMKAEDMAKRNYFDHVNPEGIGINYFIQKAGYNLPKEWTDKISNNFCESLSAGSQTPKNGIIQLISDGGVSDHKSAGHRVHLLGINDFFSKAYDIGIGWATNPNSTYKNYLVVITARHEW
jgi:uncharacterized protein YkwD